MEHQVKTQNLKKYNAAYNFLMNNNISTVQQLEERVSALSSQANELITRINANTARAKQLQEMININENAKRLQPLIDKMNTIHWKGTRDKFQASHRTDIDLYYTSKRILKDVHHVSKVDISKWEEEQEALYQQEEKLSAEYRPLREMLNQLLNVQHCIGVARSDDRKKNQEKKKDQPRLG